MCLIGRKKFFNASYMITEVKELLARLNPGGGLVLDGCILLAN